MDGVKEWLKKFEVSTGAESGGIEGCFEGGGAVGWKVEFNQCEEGKSLSSTNGNNRSLARLIRVYVLTLIMEGRKNES